MTERSKTSEVWVRGLDNTLAEIRVASGIAHAASLALLGKEEIQREPLAYALNYLCDVCVQCEAFLQEVDAAHAEEA